MGVGELESVCLPKGIHVQMFHKQCAEQTKIFWGWIWARSHYYAASEKREGKLVLEFQASITDLRGLGTASSEEVREVGAHHSR